MQVASERRVKAADLTPEAWSPFGWLPLEDTDPQDGAKSLEFEWGDPHANVISHAPDEIEHVGPAFHCDRLYRHDTHTQALLVLNCDAVVAVAPSDVDFSDPSDFDKVRAFELHPLDCLVLNRGTWHWGPFPLGEEPVRLFNVQGLGYRDDNASVDLDERELGFDVVTGPAG